MKELTLERMLQGVWFVGLGPEGRRQEDRLKTIHHIFSLGFIFHWHRIFDCFDFMVNHYCLGCPPSQ